MDEQTVTILVLALGVTTYLAKTVLELVKSAKKTEPSGVETTVRIVVEAVTEIMESTVLRLLLDRHETDHQAIAHIDAQISELKQDRAVYREHMAERLARIEAGQGVRH